MSFAKGSTIKDYSYMRLLVFKICVWLLSFCFVFSQADASESFFSHASADVNELLGPMPHWLDRKALFLSKDKPCTYPLKMISGKDTTSYEVRYLYSKDTKVLDQVSFVKVLPTGIAEELVTIQLNWKIFGARRLLTNVTIENQEKECLISHAFKYNDRGSLRRHVVEGGFLKGDVERRESSYTYDDENKLERFSVKTSGKKGRIVTTHTETEKTSSKYDSVGYLVLKEEIKSLPNSVWRKESTAFIKDKISSRSTLEWELGLHNEIKWLSVIGSNGTPRTIRYRYDRKGQVIEKTKPDGVSLRYEYDKDGRISHISSSDHSVDYHLSYDEQDHITESYDAINAKTVKRQFSEDGQLIREVQNGLTVRCEFEGKSKKRIILPDESAIDYYYNEDGSLKRIKRLDQSLFSVYEYNMGVIKEYVESFYPQIKNFTNSNVAFEAQDPIGLYEVDVSYDNLGQVSKEAGEFEHNYIFDALGRCVSKDENPVVLNEFGQIISDGRCEYDYDANGNLLQKRKAQKITKYSYDALDRLIKVEQDDNKEEYIYDIFYRRLVAKSLKGVAIFLWNGNEELGSMRSDKIQELKVTPNIVELPLKPYKPYLAIRDYRDSIVSLIDLTRNIVAETYRYSAFGEEKIFNEEGVEIPRPQLANPWGFCGKRRVKGLDVLCFGKRFYDSDLMGFVSQDPLTFVDGINSTGFVLNDPIRNIDPDGLFTVPVDFEHLKNEAATALNTIYKKSVQTLTLAQSQMEWFYDFQAHFEDVGFKVMHKTFWTMLGYNPVPTMTGVMGEVEGHDKVRLTMINGMLNPYSGTQANATLVSKLHGNNKVHYLYAATKGFTGDVLRSIFAKAGFISPQARLLAKTWKELIADMGGANGGGKIIHYAHSLGGADTYGALQLLSLDECKMIHVNTFGSPVFVDKTRCASATNFASTNDVIPYFDVIGYAQAMANKRDDVKFLESKAGLLDHSFSGETYKTTLEELGRNFQAEYLKGQILGKALDASAFNKSPRHHFTPKAPKRNKPGKILWVKRKVNSFVRLGKFKALGRILRSELNKTISLEQVESIAVRHNNRPILKAIFAAKNIKGLNTELGLKRSEILQLTLFIETELKNHLKKKKHYLREAQTGLPRIIEFDPKTKRVFIHLGTNKIAMIGQGCHKTVTKSILYNLEQPEIVANCRAPVRDQFEMKLIKTLQGIPGIVEGKAFITHTQAKDQEDMLEIICKLYNASSLRSIFYNNSEQFSLLEKMEIALQLLQGLEGIHKINIIHRDLHSANFLIDVKRDMATGKREVKAAITDFGRAIKKDECKGIDPQAYRWYRAPETFFYEKMVPNDYPASDIYALGCVLYHLFYEKDPTWFNDKYFKYTSATHSEKAHTHAKKILSKTILGETETRKEFILSKEEITPSEHFELLIFQMVDPQAEKRGTAVEHAAKMQEILQRANLP
jgi:RHS repeat-associated protein